MNTVESFDFDSVGTLRAMNTLARKKSIGVKKIFPAEVDTAEVNLRAKDLDFDKEECRDLLGEVMRKWGGEVRPHLSQNSKVIYFFPRNFGLKVKFEKDYKNRKRSGDYIKIEFLADFNMVKMRHERLLKLVWEIRAAYFEKLEINPRPKFSRMDIYYDILVTKSFDVFSMETFGDPGDKKYDIGSLEHFYIMDRKTGVVDGFILTNSVREYVVYPKSDRLHSNLKRGFITTQKFDAGKVKYGTDKKGKIRRTYRFEVKLRNKGCDFLNVAYAPCWIKKVSDIPVPEVNMTIVRNSGIASRLRIVPSSKKESVARNNYQDWKSPFLWDLLLLRVDELQNLPPRVRTKQLSQQVGDKYGIDLAVLKRGLDQPRVMKKTVEQALKELARAVVNERGHDFSRSSILLELEGIVRKEKREEHLERASYYKGLKSFSMSSEERRFYSEMVDYEEREGKALYNSEVITYRDRRKDDELPSYYDGLTDDELDLLDAVGYLKQ